MVFSSEWFGRDGGWGCRGCALSVRGRGRRCRKKKIPFLLGQNLLQKLTLAWGVGRRRRRLLAWTGRRGYLHGSGVKGRSSRCLLATNKKCQPNWVVSPSSLDWGENGTAQDQVRERKETEGNHKAQHHHSQRRENSLFQRLETRRLLVQSLLLFPSGIILQIFF